MRLLSTLFLLVLLVPLATAFPIYEPFAGSQFKYSNGSLIRTGSLQVEVFDAATGSGYVYAHNFTNRIINGSFAAVLGLDANELELVQGKNYYYDIRINGVDQDFQDNAGISLERLPFTASRGNVSGFASCGVNAVATFNLTTGNFTCVSVASNGAIVENLTNVNASLQNALNGVSGLTANLSAINVSVQGISTGAVTNNLSLVNASVVALNGTATGILADLAAYKTATNLNLTGLNASWVALNASTNGIWSIMNSWKTAIDLNLSALNVTVSGVVLDKITANLSSVNASVVALNGTATGILADLAAYKTATNLNLTTLNSSWVALNGSTNGIWSIMNSWKSAIDLNLSGLNATVTYHTTTLNGITANMSNINASVKLLNTTFNTIFTGSGLNATGVNASKIGAFNLYIYNYTCWNYTGECAGGRMIEYVNSSGCIIRVTSSGGTDNWC